MALSDYGTFIIAMAYFGEPDSKTLDFIEDQYQETYTAAALSQFRKRYGIHKNSRAEYIAIRYGLEIVERFHNGETVKDIADSLGFQQKHVSLAIKGNGVSTEKRCTQSFLLENYRCELIGFVGKGIACRTAADWLGQNRGLNCSKNVVLEAMKAITNETRYLAKMLESIAWVFELQPQQRKLALKELFTEISNLNPMDS